MSHSRSLLPPNATPLERAFETAADRLRAPAVHTLWDPWECPVHLLPWLAYAVGVGEWSDGWEEATKRQAIASAMAIARRRGSVWSVREALRAAGYADAEVEEGLPALRHDGTQLRDGYETYGSGNRWAMFKLVADLGEERGVNRVERERLIRLVDAAKPVRSQLYAIDYRASVTDVATPDERDTLIAEPTLRDVRPAGRRRDGSLERDNAIRLPPAPVYRDGTWAHGGELARTGVSPYAEWRITGETRDNDWDRQAVAIDIDQREHATVIDPVRTGAAHRDGAFARGAGLPSAYDDAALAVRPALADTIAVGERQGVTLATDIRDVRPAGRRRDGSLERDNAIRLPPAPVYRDGTWAHGGELSRTGVSPYAEWRITGETRDNDWDRQAVAIDIDQREHAAIRPPARNAAGRRDSTLTHGGRLPAALDPASLQIHIRQRRNARLRRNSGARRVALATHRATL